MRLSDIEKKSIIEAIESFDKKAEIYLFGSRADDSKKGGDIDLLVISNVDIDKVKALVKIKTKIGDQKIDLIISKFSDIKKEPFISKIHKDSVRVK